MVKDRRRDTWVGVSNLLDLIWQPEHHFSQQLGVGFKHIRSMSLKRGETVSSHSFYRNHHFNVLKVKM